MLSTPDLHRIIRDAVKNGEWLISQHAQIRMIQRGFTAPDIEKVLKGGVHTAELDELKKGTWRYRIKGSTVAGDEIQIAVIIESKVIVVTVMN